MSYLTDAGALLIEVLFGLATFLFLIRVMLQLVGANFHNPICQFFYKVTNPVLMPMRKFIPPVGRWDMAGTGVALSIEMLRIALLGALGAGVPNLLALLVFAIAGVLALLLTLLFWLIIARIILSFISSDSYHPATPLIMQLTEPVMAPFRRLLPATGGLDLSPLLATLAIMLARVLLVRPIFDLAGWLS